MSGSERPVFDDKQNKLSCLTTQITGIARESLSRLQALENHGLGQIAGRWTRIRIGDIREKDAYTAF